VALHVDEAWHFGNVRNADEFAARTPRQMGVTRVLAMHGAWTARLQRELPVAG